MLFFIHTVSIGILATLFMDLFSIINKKLFKITPLNYAIIGRWVLHWKSCKFAHNNIMQTQTLKNELVLGWIIHYITGVSWTYLYFVMCTYFSYEINLLNTIIFTSITTLLPFMVIQPFLGFGFFAYKTPSPIHSIRNSLIAHITFGVGIFYSYKILQ